MTGNWQAPKPLLRQRTQSALCKSFTHTGLKSRVSLPTYVIILFYAIQPPPQRAALVQQCLSPPQQGRAGKAARGSHTPSLFHTKPTSCLTQTLPTWEGLGIASAGRARQANRTRQNKHLVPSPPASPPASLHPPWPQTVKLWRRQPVPGLAEPSGASPGQGGVLPAAGLEPATRGLPARAASGCLMWSARRHPAAPLGVAVAGALSYAPRDWAVLSRGPMAGGVSAERPPARLRRHLAAAAGSRADSAMPHFQAWEEFTRAAEKLYLADPMKVRQPWPGGGAGARPGRGSGALEAAPAARNSAGAAGGAGLGGLAGVCTGKARITEL